MTLEMTPPHKPIPDHSSVQSASSRTQSRLFKSFWLGGFESACHINSKRCRVDMTAATQHDVMAEDDYRLLRSVGIRAARDGARWHLIEGKPKHYDFSTFLPMLRAAHRQGVQIIWNLCHYGWPED